MNLNRTDQRPKDPFSKNPQKPAKTRKKDSRSREGDKGFGEQNQPKSLNTSGRYGREGDIGHKPQS